MKANDERERFLMIAITSEIRCIGCNQILTDRLSIERGYGDRCRDKLNRAAHEVAKRYSCDQILKATIALRDGRVRFYMESWKTPHGSTIYRVESGTTNEVYYTTSHSCTCPASVQCYHMCTVEIRELVPFHRY